MYSYERSLNRRKFFALTSGAVATMSLGVRKLSAADTAETFLPGPLDASVLKTLASTALEAAKNAGAQYADVRFSQQQKLSVRIDPAGAPISSIGSTFSYGIRVIANNVSAFGYGNLPVVDSVAGTARNTVAQARGLSKILQPQAGMAPAAPAVGEWASAYQIDPFRVPLLEQADTIGALQAIADGRLQGMTVTPTFDWMRETRVCASTDGMLTTQTFLRAEPEIFIEATWIDHIYFQFPDLLPKLAGYECVTGSDLQNNIKDYLEMAHRYIKLPGKALDVGRYPVVMDGTSVGRVILSTIGPALQMDRVLGYETNASGTSFLSPHNEILGTELFSPLLSVTADRSLNTISAAKWDDEGVAPVPVNAISDGKVVDYLTNRQTALSLGDWYQRNNIPLKSNGFASTSEADRPTTITTGNLTVRSGSEKTSVEDLTRNVKKGLLLLQALWVNTDQQLVSGQIGSGILLEIKNGTIVNRINHAALQFKTTQLLKQMTIIGGQGTVGLSATRDRKGQPWQVQASTASSPAAHFSAIDVIQVGI